MEVVSQFMSGQFLYTAAAVIAVVTCAITVFVFGFKSAEQPAFDKLSSSAADDRKQAGKKRKIKEKRSTANGHVTSVTESASKSKSSEIRTTPVKKVPIKEKPVTVTKEISPVLAKQLKEKKQETESTVKESVKKNDKKLKVNKGKENKEVVEVKNKKNLKQKQPEEKPLDFDDGNWEIVPLKNDKKNRKVPDEVIKEIKKESPKKSTKKVKKIEEILTFEPIIDNKSIDEVTKEIKDKVNEQQKAAAEEEKKAEVVLTPVIPTVEIAITAAVDETSTDVDDSKKKKNKKPKVKSEEPEKPVVSAPAAPKKEKTKAEIIVKTLKIVEAVEQVVVFDELGDVWTEAKAPKKSKKKARKE